MIDHRIPMGFQTPDFVGSMARGAQAGQFVNDARHQNALRAAVQEHGAGLVAGDDGARNALAGFDPGMVMQADAHRQTMSHNDERMQLAREEGRRQAIELAQRMSAEQLEQERGEIINGLRALAPIYEQGDPQAFAQAVQGLGLDPSEFTFESFPSHAAIYSEVLDTWEQMQGMVRGPGPQSSAGKFFADQRDGYIPEGVPLPSGVTVNTGEQGPRTGTIPPGMMLVDDPEAPGGLRMAPIAGGPAEQEAAQAQEQEAARQAQRARAGSTVIQDLQRGLDLLSELGPIARGEGVAGGLARTGQAQIPGTVANRITQFTESALSNVGLDTLQQMRENSPTGGALGQVPIQQQQRLEQVLGSLNINQPPSVLDANIRRVMNIYTDIIYGSAEERARAVEQGRMSPQQNAEIESFYYELPFDERGRPMDSAPMPQSQTPAQTGPSDDDLLRMYGGQ